MMRNRFVLLALLALAQLQSPASAGWTVDPAFQGETLGSTTCVGEPVMVGQKQVFQLVTLLGPEFILAKFTPQGRLDTSWASAGTARQLPEYPRQVMALPSGAALLFSDYGALTRLTERGTVDATYGPVTLRGSLHSAAPDQDGGLVVATKYVTTMVFTRLDSAGKAVMTRELPTIVNADSAYAWSFLEDGTVEVGTIDGQTGTIVPRVRRFSTGTVPVDVSPSERLIPVPGVARYVSSTVKVDATGAVTFALPSGPFFAPTVPPLSVYRFLPTGEADTAFGTSGKVALDTGDSAARPIALTMSPDGGWAVVFDRFEHAFSTLAGHYYRDSAEIRELSSTGGVRGAQFVGTTTVGASYYHSIGRAFNAAHQDDGSLIAAINGPAGCALQRLTSDTGRTEAAMFEYYHPTLDHYFLTLDGLEAQVLDANPGYGWKRTGQTFGAWMPQAIPGGTVTCRFYGDLKAGPNSHFYIPEGAGCSGLQQLEAAAPIGTKAWRLEGRTFTVREAFGGSCPANLDPIYRLYNRGFERGIDSNHRYTDSSAVADAMVKAGWVKEGIAFCLPPQSTRSLRSTL